MLDHLVRDLARQIIDRLSDTYPQEHMDKVTLKTIELLGLGV